MNRRRVPPPFALALALSLPAFALPAQETGAIVGAVVDQSTGSPLIGAVVSLTEEEVSAVTDRDGHFRIEGLDAGEISVRVQHLAHVAVVEQVSVTPQEVTFVQFRLSPVSFMLDQLKVITERNPDRDGSASSELEPDGKDGAFTAMDLLVARFPSLSITGNDRNGGSTRQVRIRGVSSVTAGNTPALYVDGVRADMSLLTSMSSAEVRSIRVLRGPSASSVYLDAANGVILVETRRGTFPGGGG